MAERKKEKQRVFVTGGGAVTPQGPDWKSTWGATLAGKIAIQIIPDKYAPILHYDSETLMPPGARGSSVRHGGFIGDFDPTVHLPGKMLKRRARCAQLVVVASKEAMEQAGLEPLPRLSGKEDRPEHPINRKAARRFVTIGAGFGDGINVINYQQRLIRGEIFDAVAPMKVEPEQAATTENQIWNFQGAGKTEVIACASGGGAIIDIARKIRNGEADVGIAGGVDSFVRHLTAYALYQAATALATFKTGEDINPYYASMPFNPLRRGFVHSEGAAVLVLESEDHIRERGAEGKILAELVGWAETNDASELGKDTEPKVRGQVMTMSLAAEMAGISPEEVDYVNAHGTGTPVGDPREFVSVLTFRKNNASGLYLSGTKAMVGHGISWTAVKEALEVMYAIREKKVPPTPNHDTMMEIQKDLLEEWNIRRDYYDLDVIPQTTRNHPIQIGMSNSFGFGGNNNTLVLKEFTGF